MTTIMLIYAAMFAVAFYCINSLFNRFYIDQKRITKLEVEFNNFKYDVDNLYEDVNYLKIKLDKTNHNVEQDKNNIDACANAILNIRNNVGKLGNRLQAIERKGNNE